MLSSVSSPAPSLDRGKTRPDDQLSSGELGDGPLYAPGGLSDVGHPGLISSIYAATLAPHDFKKTVDRMDAEITRILAEKTGVPDVGDQVEGGLAAAINSAQMADLANQIETAQRIQSQMGFHADEPDKIDVLLGFIPNPAVVFDRDERILRKNGRARALDCGASPNLAGLFRNTDQITEIRKAIRTLDDGRAFAAVPLNLSCDNGVNDCAIIKQVQINDGTGGSDRLFIMNLAHFSFDEAIRESFKDVYRLTDAETAVAVLLSSGTTVEEIADLRGVSQQTVRSQIKAIKSKTHVRDLPDLVRLLCGFSLSIAMPTPQKERTPEGRPTEPSLHVLHLRDGRSLNYLVQGDPEGRPVLLFHNLPHGLQLPRAAIRFARRHRLKLVAPIRPGFGGSDPLPDCSDAAYLHKAASDTSELCEALGINRAKLLGVGSGSTFATRFATLYPDNVTSIVMVGHAPIWRPERLGLMPAFLRLLVQLTRHMPELANVVAGAILASISKHDHRTFAKEACNGSPSDLQALDDAELTALMDHEITIALKSDPRTLAREWGLLAADLSQEAKLLPHPIHLLHGAEDRVLAPDFSRQFADAVPQTKLQIINDGGHHLFHSHWQRILDTLLFHSE